ncbi:MAG TPA: bifunctional ADP-heptose synthase [Chloroflexia bacterium]|nr:bifunctional ADP-heptose synthase [Chloroflexia bacterium]
MPLASYLPLFSSKKVLVIGDLYLDEYIVGRPSRISREAPIAVLEFCEQRSVPGGATAPACNIASLGGQAYMLGVIGDDHAGRELQELLAARSVDTAGLVVDSKRPTTTKTRIVAEAEHIFPQQVARVDRLDRTPIDGDVEKNAIDYIHLVAPNVDAILFSDYKAGVVNPRLIEAGLQAAWLSHKLVTVDSQGGLDKFKGCTLVKCNDHEASDYLRRELSSDADFEKALLDLREELGARMVVITRGGEGMSILDDDGELYHLQAFNRSEVFDVTGAGDTVISLLTLGLVAGASLLESAELANAAAGVVIRKQGNVSIQLDELTKELEKLGL